MAFAYRNRVSFWVTLRRFDVLTVVGIIYGAVAVGEYSWDHLRLTGTLQLYAALVALLAFAHVLARRWWMWMGLTLALASGYTYFLHSFAATCVGNELTTYCNPSGTYDTLLLGSHMYAGGTLGHDPEGIFGIIGALITAMVGTSAGHLLVHLRNRRPERVVPALLAWAGAVGVYGVVLELWVPWIKRLWTPPFGLISAALGVAVMAVVYQIVDARRPAHSEPPPCASPFIALGRNSLLVYFGSHLLVDVLARWGEPSIAVRIAETVTLGLPFPLGFVFLNLAAWWGLSLVLHKFKVYIHA
ncbi:MAG: heparan-alpha-glucosaminide N-acetyltransferase [Bowdeniella nasicola]|nr:heparan-alpha-glucosaminide N-acetyltransferase [Bowdeniella nasicola]